MFSLEMADAKPMNLILTSSDTAYGLYNINPNINIYVSNVSLFFNLSFKVVLTLVWVDVCGALVKGKQNADHATYH